MHVHFKPSVAANLKGVLLRLARRRACVKPPTERPCAALGEPMSMNEGNRRSRSLNLTSKRQWQLFPVNVCAGDFPDEQFRYGISIRPH